MKDDAFLPDTIENLRKTATPVPLLIGLNSKEGRMAFSGNEIIRKKNLKFIHTSRLCELFEMLIRKYSLVFGNNLLELLKSGFSGTVRQPPNIDDCEFQNIYDKVKRRYMSDEPVSEETAEKVVDVRFAKSS